MGGKPSFQSFLTRARYYSCGQGVLPPAALALAVAAMVLLPLWALGQPGPVTPIEAARDLVRRRDPQAKAKLLKQLAAETVPAQKAALLGVLGNLKPGSLAPEDLEAYLTDPDALVRLEAVQTLGKQQTPEALARLRRVLKDDASEGVRLAAAFWLSQAADDQASALGDALEQDSNPNVRAQAAHGLKRMGTRKARNELKRGDRERNPAVKKALDAK